MQERLKPCPFCGSEAEVIGHYIKGVANNYQYFVRCKACKARPRTYATFKKKEQAIEVWNGRKPIDRIVEQLEKIAPQPKSECYAHVDEYLCALEMHEKCIEIVKGGVE